MLDRANTFKKQGVGSKKQVQRSSSRRSIHQLPMKFFANFANN